ncbi:HlyD family type I secretion periplasmic adaptor subunit [Tabrizicola sp.]|jgi:membrane fusion protein, adhesin transport system|uniref:HlyD family type I secretion periplasmic adaptor subunit n=1 Tax=Tabrizicola sp. TaxID=2005166 RepID=UPI003D283AC9
MSDMNFRKISDELAGKQSMFNSAILFSTAGLIATFAIWASFAELDNVTRGQGKVASSVQNQLVQAGEGGVILRRYVSENSAVTEGEVLFEIDPVDSASELNRLMERRLAMSIKEARLRAEIAQTDFTIADELRAGSPIVAATEENLFMARKAELSGALAVLEQQRNQRLQDLEGAAARRDSAGRTMDLIQKEIDVVQPMVAENIAPETRLLELQRELESARGQFDAGNVAISQAEAGIAAIDGEISNRREAYVLQSMDELAAVVADLSELNEALPLLQERVSRTVIRAPMDGIVYRLNYRTPGGYIKTGDVVLEMVPTGEDLVVAAQIDPKDISNIRLDDAVRIRLSAYDSSRYGTLDGRVTRISADALANEETGTTYYQVDVAIEGTIMLEDGVPVVLKPGMTATVDVLSGKRTIWAYIWEPVAKVKELALRD